MEEFNMESRHIGRLEYRFM